MDGIPEQDTPELLVRQGIDPDSIRLVDAKPIQERNDINKRNQSTSNIQVNIHNSGRIAFSLDGDATYNEKE
ncbi:hypothetical protein [Candidatus Villigracilis affinis]|uniref:hypothetical protein n=1 Tax=Candidatus Villigracilis affinis TaxID=3140682 RepID=UPI001D29407D|nr:hypothetical protein [Anaerolineales bacterium]